LAVTVKNDGGAAAQAKLDLDAAAELEKKYDSEMQFRNLSGFAARLVPALSLLHGGFRHPD
jgi:hypothetical protein